MSPRAAKPHVAAAHTLAQRLMPGLLAQLGRVTTPQAAPPTAPDTYPSNPGTFGLNWRRK